MPRYEFSEGSSNKFWEIVQDGTSFTTTWGKIGTSGQSKTQDFSDEAKCDKEYNKLIAEKEKKGYELVSKNGGGAKKPAKAAKKEVFDDEGDDEEDEKPKKKAAAKSGGGGGGKRMFEFSEGSSNKFWEVWLEGTAYKTRWGKIGTSGQITVKEYDTEEKAKKEYDKIIAEKTKKGYEEV